jgi:hypothetical protein
MEIVTATLTGIALIKKSVDFIKENINTVQDISGIAKQIDGFFLGEEQMNKGQGKGMSIAEQFGSVEKSADDFINRKLLEEKRQELKFIINMRFGATAWEEIIAERANRINEAKEAQKQVRIKARKQQEEIMEILKWVGYTFIGIGLMLAVLVVTVKAFAKGKIYNAPKDYTRNQKLNNGTIIPPTMTTCRLKKMKVFKNKLACIYVGANKTYEMEFTDVHIGCPRNYKCVLNPNGKEPSIDSVMESLRSIAK